MGSTHRGKVCLTTKFGKEARAQRTGFTMKGGKTPTILET